MTNGEAELEAALNRYKGGEYNLGRYEDEEDIKNAYLNDKIFVLTTVFGVGKTAGLICMWGLGAFFFAVPFFTGYYSLLGIAIFAAILFFCIGGLLLLTIGQFIVFGPQGMYYKKWGSPKYFSWVEVENIRGRERIIKTMTIMEVTCYFSYGEKTKFSSKVYKRMEFPKKGYRRLFYALFGIYWQLGRRSKI